MLAAGPFVHLKTSLNRLPSTCQTSPQQSRGAKLEENQEENQEQGGSSQIF